MGTASPVSSVSPSAIERTPSAVQAAAVRWHELNCQGSKREADRLAEQIIEALMPLIARLSRQHQEYGVSRDELLQAGRVALYQALTRWKPGHRASFRTFAYTGVFTQLMNYVRDNCGDLIKLPTYLKDQRRVIHKWIRTMPKATDAEIAELAEVDIADVAAARVPMPRADLRFGPGNDYRQGIINPDTHLACAVDWTDATDTHLQVQQALTWLPIHTRGLIDDRLAGLTFQEIADKQGCSRQRVEQRFKAALTELRSILAD